MSATAEEFYQHAAIIQAINEAMRPDLLKAEAEAIAWLRTLDLDEESLRRANKRLRELLAVVFERYVAHEASKLVARMDGTMH